MRGEGAVKEGSRERGRGVWDLGGEAPPMTD